MLNVAHLHIVGTVTVTGQTSNLGFESGQAICYVGNA